MPFSASFIPHLNWEKNLFIQREEAKERERGEKKEKGRMRDGERRRKKQKDRQTEWEVLKIMKS